MWLIFRSLNAHTGQPYHHNAHKNWWMSTRTIIKWQVKLVHYLSLGLTLGFCLHRHRALHVLRYADIFPNTMNTTCPCLQYSNQRRQTCVTYSSTLHTVTPHLLVAEFIRTCRTRHNSIFMTHNIKNSCNEESNFFYRSSMKTDNSTSISPIHVVLLTHSK